MALAVRPHFGIFVSVCRGEKERERESAQGEDRERAGVLVCGCESMMSLSLNVLKTECDERLALTIISTILVSSTKKNRIFTRCVQLFTIISSHENLLSAAFHATVSLLHGEKGL